MTSNKYIVFYYLDSSVEVDKGENKIINDADRIDYDKLGNNKHVIKKSFKIDDPDAIFKFFSENTEWHGDDLDTLNEHFLKADLFAGKERVNTIYNYTNYYRYGKNQSLLEKYTSKFKSPYPNNYYKYNPYNHYSYDHYVYETNSLLCFAFDYETLVFIERDPTEKKLIGYDRHAITAGSCDDLFHLSEIYEKSLKDKVLIKYLVQEDDLAEDSNKSLINELENISASRRSEYKSDIYKLFSSMASPDKMDELDANIKEFIESLTGLEEIFKTQKVVLDDNFVVYEDEIKELNVPSVEEINNLINEYKKGNEEAFNKIVTSKLGIVTEIVKLYSNNGIPASDLLQEGNLALIESVKRAKTYTDIYSINPRLNTLIYKNVTKAIVDYIVSKGIQIEFTPEIKLYLKELNRIKTVLAGEKEYNGLDIVINIADYLKIDMKEAIWLCSLISMDSEVLDSTIEYDLYDDMSVEDEVMEKLMKEDVSKLLDSLDERTRLMLDMYYGLEGYEKINQGEIGKIFNVSRAAVSQSTRNAVKSLIIKANNLELHDYLER